MILVWTAPGANPGRGNWESVQTFLNDCTRWRLKLMKSAEVVVVVVGRREDPTVHEHDKSAPD